MKLCTYGDQHIYQSSSVLTYDVPRGNTTLVVFSKLHVVALFLELKKALDKFWLFAAEGRHCFVPSVPAQDNGMIRVNALTGPQLRSCGLITGS
jgi:hypothetical protein